MLHMRKIDNSSAECEIAAADFRNIAPSLVHGKGSIPPSPARASGRPGAQWAASAYRMN